MHDAKLAGISGGKIGEYVKIKMDDFERQSRSQKRPPVWAEVFCRRAWQSGVTVQKGEKGDQLTDCRTLRVPHGSLRQLLNT